MRVLCANSVFADSEVWLREEAVVHCETDAVLKFFVLLRFQRCDIDIWFVMIVMIAMTILVVYHEKLCGIASLATGLGSACI